MVRSQKFPRRRRHTRPARRGAIVILLAILLPLFVIMAAFSVDVAWMQLARTEMRTATDAASRAGAKTLSLTQDEALARQGAIAAAARNTVAGSPLQLVGRDIVFGASVQRDPAARFVFDPSSRQVNAVQVNASRSTGSPGGGVNLFFSGLLGVTQFEPAGTCTSTILDRDIALVLDRSGSMRGQKLADLKKAVRAFIRELEETIPDEELGLVTYSTRSTPELSLSRDYPRVSRRSDDMGASGNTAIGEGLRDGIQTVTGTGSREFAVPTVVLMTDGQHNTGPEPIIFARQAASQNITVHTVTFGAGADITRMRAVANATPDGRHFHADSGQDLQEVFREIARTLPVIITD